MELLIAVLIAFGVVTSSESEKIRSSEEAYKIGASSGLTQQEMDKEAAIIGLEEDSM